MGSTIVCNYAGHRDVYSWTQPGHDGIWHISHLPATWQ